jgi:DNA adenine methylase
MRVSGDSATSPDLEVPITCGARIFSLTVPAAALHSTTMKRNCSSLRTEPTTVTGGRDGAILLVPSGVSGGVRHTGTSTLCQPTQRMRRNPQQILNRKLAEARASSPLSAQPRPFLRWAGSKRWLLRQMIASLPTEFTTYHEPFLGSGALFFLLCPTRASLSDKCSELIDVYKATRDNVSAIIRYLRPLRPDRKLFYAMRDRPSRGWLKRAAEFMYLNKTCWNGLYRVNSEGRFNVPYGMPKTTFIADLENLRACARALRVRDVNLRSCDFQAALTHVEPGDLVYLDPPYVTQHNNNGFVDYNEILFSWEDQKRLAMRARQLADTGAYVIATNANHREVLELYRGFVCRTLTRSSTLASNANRRVRVKEALLCSPNCIEGA